MSTILESSTTHRLLLGRAQSVGPDFYRLIHDLLEVHAYLNLRRAQGLVSLMHEGYDHHLLNQAARFVQSHRLRPTPRDLRHLLQKLQADQSAQRLLPFSDASQEFVRDISYFIKKQEPSI